MNWLLTRIQQEPVMLQGIVQAALGLAVSFGTNLSSQQIAGILLLSASILSFVTRSQVTPITSPKANDGSPLLAAKQPGS
jgi:hypothetical protein